MNTPRVALYGHDTLGLGHLRRNLALAAAIGRAEARPDVLVITGAAEATAFDLPPGVDLLTVPGVAKDDHGRYGSRRLRGGLDAVLAVRGAAIAGALEAFDPDLLVIDKVPHGLRGELGPALARMRRAGRTRVVLGLRDVLDAPAAARDEWRMLRMNDALRTFVDEVWVYGDQAVHDLGDACAVPPALRRRLRYTGYLSTGRVDGPEPPPGLAAGDGYVLCTVGGGQDGADLARAFAAATLPAGTVGVVVTGSQMPAEHTAELRRLAAGRRDMIVIGFHPRVERWIAGARAVVAMGGYNTVSEILATTTPALVAPRVRPRREQAVRAEALRRRGLVDGVDGVDRVDRVGGAERADPPGVAPAALSRWLREAVARPRRWRHGIDLDGLAVVTHRTSRLLGETRALAV